MATCSLCSWTVAVVVVCEEIWLEAVSASASVSEAASEAALETVARKEYKQHQASRHVEGYGLQSDSKCARESELGQVGPAGCRAAPPIASQSSESVGRRLLAHWH